MPRNILTRSCFPFLVILLFAFCGCRPVLSLQPYYTAKDIAFDEKLLGTWERLEPGKKHAEQWSFTQGQPGVYEVWLKDAENERLHFSAHSFQLGGKYFFDLYPAENFKETFRFDLVPAHILVRYEVADGKLRMFALAPALQDKLKNGEFSLAHAVIDQGPGDSSGDLILTADTAALQEFLVNTALKDPKAFSEYTEEAPLVKKGRH